MVVIMVEGAAMVAILSSRARGSGLKSVRKLAAKAVFHVDKDVLP
jgi:hypothetical protein